MLTHLVHRAGSRVRNSTMLRHQRWLWQTVEPQWNKLFARVSEDTGYPAELNGETFRLEYAYGARYDRQDRRTYEPEFYLPFVARIREGMTVFDVGAHVGIFSLGAGVRVGPSGRVFAFECGPDTAATLRRHVGFNHLAPPIEVIEKAVSDSDAGVTFYAYRASMAASMARANVETLNPEVRSEPARELSVESVTLDAFTAERGLRPDVIKIDVEGAEFRVLQGARRMLAGGSPLIFCEIHPQQMQNVGGSVAELLDFVASLGYTATPIDRPNPAGIYHARIEKVRR